MTLGIGLWFSQRGLGGGGTAPVISATPLLTDNAIDVTGDLPMTFHYTNTASATPPSAATIKAAPDSRSLVSGANSLTGLTQEVTAGTWYFHYLVSNAAGDSAIETESYVVVAAFDPASLSGARVVVDISDMATLWQDTAGTTQITASGQTVGSVTNRGSLGGLFVNTGGSDEPTYTEAAGRKYLNFDGVNDFLTLTHGSDVSLAGGYRLFLVAFDDGTSNDLRRSFASMAGTGVTAYNQVNGLSAIMTDFGSDPLAIHIRAGTDNTQGFETQLQDTRTTTLPWAVVEVEFVPTAASPNGWLRVEKSGDGAPVDIASHSTANGGSSYPDFATQVRRFTLGADMGGGSGALSAFGKSSIAAFVIVAGTLTNGERDDLRAWCRARAVF